MIALRSATQNKTLIVRTNVEKRFNVLGTTKTQKFGNIDNKDKNSLSYAIHCKITETFNISISLDFCHIVFHFY